MNILVGLVFGTVLLFSMGLSGAAGLMSLTNGEVITQGVQRRYLVYKPKTYLKKSPSALVISLHGYGEWPDHLRQMSHWNQIADEEGLLAVYPEGISLPRLWRLVDQDDPPVDGVFINDLINQLQAQYTIDPRRIYINGFSNGGGLSHLVSCMSAERVAAIGGVGGSYLYPWESCHPSRPVPMIAFHGTADPIVPYHGPGSEMFEYEFPDVPTWIATLAQRNGCQPTPQTLPAQGEITGQHYHDCDQGADVNFYTIQGGGHSWPGGEPLPEFWVGKTSDDMDATRAIWDFFKAHPLPLSEQ